MVMLSWYWQVVCYKRRGRRGAKDAEKTLKTLRPLRPLRLRDLCVKYPVMLKTDIFSV